MDCFSSISKQDIDRICLRVYHVDQPEMPPRGLEYMSLQIASQTVKKKKEAILKNYNFNNTSMKVIFSHEFFQNLNLVKPTQYDGRSHVKSG